MSKTGRPNYRRNERENKHRIRYERHIYLRTVPKETPDLHMVARAFLALVEADVRADNTAAAEESVTQQADTGDQSGSACTDGDVSGQEQEADHDAH